MRRGLRLIGAAALACSTVPVVGVSPAYADTASLVAVNGAYFNAAGIDKPEAAPQAPPNVTASADGVSPENLPVAAKGGTEDKVSFLLFDLVALPSDTVVNKAVVRMLLVPNSQNDITVNAAPENVQACMAGDSGFSGDDGANIDTSAPERKCDAFKAVAKASADGKAYEFDITKLAQEWVQGVNDGVAFTVADAAASSTFQVVFDKASTATLALDYTLATPAVPVDSPPVFTPPAPAPQAPPVDFGSPSLGGFAPPPAVDLGGSVPETVAVPQPQVQPQPQAQPISAPAFVPLASASMRPTGGFWLVGLLGAGALAFLSLVMGDPVVTTATGSSSRLTKTLSSRSGLAAVRAGMSVRPA
jgi:hypothetical protein